MELKSFFGNKKIYVVPALAVIIFIYYILHTKYFIYYIDDPWSMSYIYNYFKLGIDEDTIFRIPTSPDRYLIFGKTYHFLCGHFLNFLGWTKGNAHLFSTLFLFFSSGIFYLVLKKLRFKDNIAIAAALSLLVFPAFFNVANMVRPDTFVLFLIFLSFYLFMHEKYFLSAFSVMVAFESHAMGAIGIFYILAYVIYQRDRFLSDRRKLIISVCIFFAGIVAGALYYLYLHYDVLKIYDINVFLSKRKMDHPAMIYIFTYFFQSYWYRHVWEFLLICISLYLFFKHKIYKEDRFVFILFIVLLISVIITRRQNKNYMIYFYPSFLLIYFVTFDKLGRFKEFIIFLAVAMLVYFGSHYAVNRNFNFEKILRNTTSSLVEKNVPVIGMPDNWFGLMDRTFYPIYPSYVYIPGYKLEKFYLIRNDYISHRSNNYYSFLNYVSSNYNQKHIRTFKAFDEKTVTVYMYTRKER